MLWVLAGTFWNFASSTNNPTPKHPSTTPRCRASGPGGWGPRSRPELWGCRRGGRGGGRGLGGRGRTLRCSHSGLVESLSQILLILPNILLQAIGPVPHDATERKRKRKWDEKYIVMEEESERKEERKGTQTDKEKKTKQWEVKHRQLG